MIGACPASFDLIDPVLFTIPEIFGLGPFPIRWYALAYIAGLFIGLWWVLRLVSQGRLWGPRPKPRPRPTAAPSWTIWCCGS
jgi:phosphatidylglycerol:prolipoprotein diacylglycerol transferase